MEFLCYWYPTNDLDFRNSGLEFCSILNLYYNKQIAQINPLSSQASLGLGNGW